ncbi:MAG: hypothetical protein H6747_13445 [Deltaproteobacteria bacterium]|nr:hypothetical protein [Deltaproteobacteria bacterium]
MLMYLIHGHKGLGQLVFALAVAGFAFALAGAGSKPGPSQALDRVHRFGLMMVGRLNVLLGIALLLVLNSEAHRPLFTVAPWLGLLLWGPVEVLGKRLVSANVRGTPTGDVGKVRLGTGLQLLVIVLIYGAMTMARTRGW